MSSSRLITSQDVAELLHIETATVRRWFREKRLPGVRISNRWYVRLDVLERWLLEHGMEQAHDQPLLKHFSLLPSILASEDRPLGWTERELLAAIVQSSDDAIISKSLDGTILSWNAGAQRMYGYTPEEVIGKPISILVPPDQQDEIPQILSRLRRGEHIDHYETRRVHKDGRILEISLSVSPVRDEHGEIVAAAKIARNITERKQAQEHVRQLLEAEREARQRAEQADAFKLHLLAIISHELRTPLSSIKGFVTTLLAKDVRFDEQTQREFLTIADAEADKLTHLIDDLLDLSRLQVGKLTIETKMQSIYSILDTARVEMDILAHNHHLSIDLSSNLPPVLADEQRIVQVLTNLVDNAAKYSGVGTQIVVTVCQQRTDFIQFDVSDEGNGIPPSERESVFETFHQGEVAKEGLGLGLAICKGLVEAHGGRIWIQEKLPPGTTVSFTLPIVKSVS
ncbi:MAG: PAS domain S-box protein [Anaerolineae bacterium]|nr:PAS domain S-box protein [Anaerolineae bacterium]